MTTNEWGRQGLLGGVSGAERLGPSGQARGQECTLSSSAGATSVTTLPNSFARPNTKCCCWKKTGRAIVSWPKSLAKSSCRGTAVRPTSSWRPGFGRADAVVATTGSDDDNLVVCQMAKMEFSVPRTISRVNDPRSEKLFHQLGIDATVSSTKIIYNLIEQEVGGGEMIPLAALNPGQYRDRRDRDRHEIARAQQAGERPASTPGGPDHLDHSR